MVDLSPYLNPSRVDASSIIIQAVHEALQPFKPRMVYMMLGDAVWGDPVKLTIWVDILPKEKDAFVTDFDRRAMVAAHFPERIYQEIAGEAFLFFRNIRTEPSDNHVLGEN